MHEGTDGRCKRLRGKPKQENLAMLIVQKSIEPHNSGRLTHLYHSHLRGLEQGKFTTQNGLFCETHDYQKAKKTCPVGKFGRGQKEEARTFSKPFSAHLSYFAEKGTQLFLGNHSVNTPLPFFILSGLKSRSKYLASHSYTSYNFCALSAYLSFICLGNFCNL